MALRVPGWLRGTPTDAENGGSLPVLSRLGAGRSTLLAILLVVAAAVRIVWAVVAPTVDPYLVQNPLFGDAKDYVAIARHVAAGDGYTQDGRVPTAYRSPGYPIFLAGIFRLFGESQPAARMAQAAIGVLVVWLTFWIGRRLFGVRTGLLAALGVALYPTVVYFGAWLTTEVLFLLFVTAAMVLVAPACVDGRAGWCAGAGVAVGLAMLVRPQAGLLLLTFPPALLWCGRSIGVRRALGLSAVLIGCTAATIFPWAARNYLVFHAFVPVDTHGGFALYGSYLGLADGTFVDEHTAGLDGLSEVDRDRREREVAMRLMLEDPGRLIAAVPIKLLRMASPTSTVVGDVQAGWTGLALWLNLGFLALAAVGGAIGVRRVPAAAALWAVVVGTLGTALAFYGTARFAVPMIPAICVFAAYAVDRLWSAVASPPRRMVAAAVSPPPLTGPSATPIVTDSVLNARKA